MSRLKERDEQEALKLDESFKETVERVKPYVLALKDPEESHLCRKWLQKLGCASSQRSLRNQYLRELGAHLKSGHVSGIFSEPPRNGPLEPLLARFCDHMVQACSSSISEFSDTSCPVHPEASRPVTRQRIANYSVNRSSDSSSNCDCKLTANSEVRCCEKTRQDRSQFSAYKRRMASLTAIVHDLQLEKEDLKRSLYAKENCDCQKNLNLSATIDKLTMEITTLRTKLIEVNKMKEELERNHREIVEQYKSTMKQEFNDLNLRLHEARSKNEELEENIALINTQLGKVTAEKNEELNKAVQDFNEKLENIRLSCESLLAEKDKELSFKDEIIEQKIAEAAETKKLHNDEIKSLNEKIRILEDKLETKTGEENKLQSFFKEQCSTMKEEFLKMRSDLEISARSENQCLHEKISALKKNMFKLVKSKDKQSLEFENKIIHILKTKDFEIKKLELQLQEQRNEMSTSLSSEQQCEMDSLVKLLEERYKALLAATDATVGSQRKNFLKKISLLEGQVTCMKNNLVDNDLYV